MLSIDMTELGKSLVLTISICGCIAASTMLLAVPLAHMSFTSESARTYSLYVAGAALPLIVLSGFGLLTSFRSGIDFAVIHNGKTTHYAIVSFILGFPILGVMTLGVSSVAGIICGLIALRQVCNERHLNGKGLAIGGICLSFSTFPLIVVMAFFLGP